jgi:hypothetical protein
MSAGRRAWVGLSLAAWVAASFPTGAGVDLRLVREAPTQVRLDWTGGQAPFSIYRSTLPGGLVAPGNLMTTVSADTWTDLSASAPLLFYKVEPFFCTSNTDCLDASVCNGQETCVAGSCNPGTPLDCNDGIACTTDACNPATGCTHATNDGQCPCGQSCDPVIGCTNACAVKTCEGIVYQCGDCLDNDGDCRVDGADDQCLGPCDNSENSLYPAIPGFTGPACTQDCFFDRDSGSGNDACTWTHRCDPLEVPPNYSPEGSTCAYTPTATVGGRTCTQMAGSQSATCTAFCGPLIPNGCDAFGCCTIPGAPSTVWLGSTDLASGSPTCTLADVSDPTKCKPCTQVASATNTCEHCELCVGKTTLPPDCTGQSCPAGLAVCGLPGQAACAAGSYCITGCCQPSP